jgi:diphosphate-dependent phosphofructokinase
MSMEVSPLQLAQQKNKPLLPAILRDISSLTFARHGLDTSHDPNGRIKALFPHIFDLPLLKAVKGDKRQGKALRLGVVLSGGQAAGGHNVIVGLFDALKQLHAGSTLFGFLGGPSGIVNGKYEELTLEKLASYRNQGGFDLLGSGRTKIETAEQLEASLKVVQKLKLDGLIVIGGDDSNTNAAILSEYFLTHDCATNVVGVPKTIDGDLKNEYVAISFGFDTASKVYAELIGNIARDALSAKKYFHFIKLMGRTASHITLECALATHPNYALIAEEVSAEKKTLSQIINELCDLVCQRAKDGKNYGVVLVPEGLIEFIPEMGVLIKELNQILSSAENMKQEEIISKLTAPSRECFSSIPESIQKQLLLVRDPHGNVQVSLIETEKLLVEVVSKELDKRRQQGTFSGSFNPLVHFFGYEGRSGFPSNFDAQYCYALGFAAALLVEAGASGYMCFVENLTAPVEEWGIGGVPLTRLMVIETRKGKEKPVIKKALVELDSPSFLHFKKNRKSWMHQDAYRFPGPIQFWGDKNICDSIPITVSMDIG